MIKDVSRYHEYLPFCSKSELSAYTTDPKLPHLQSAEGILHIGFGPIIDKFKCQSTYNHQKLHHISENTGGMVFKSMTSSCVFKDVSVPESRQSQKPSTEYYFEIDCQMGNPVYTFIAKTALPIVSHAMINAFESRIQWLEEHELNL